MPFLPFVYGYLSSCPRAHCTPNKSVPTLHHSHRPGPIYTGHARRHLTSAVPWISEDRLLCHSNRNHNTASACTLIPPLSSKTVATKSALRHNLQKCTCMRTHTHTHTHPTSLMNPKMPFQHTHTHTHTTRARMHVHTQKHTHAHSLTHSLTHSHSLMNPRVSLQIVSCCSMADL